MVAQVGTPKVYFFKIQKRAARFVITGKNTYETEGTTGILELKWESLKKRRKDSRLIKV